MTDKFTLHVLVRIMAATEMDTFSEFVESLAAIPKMIVLDIGRKLQKYHYVQLNYNIVAI